MVKHKHYIRLIYEVSTTFWEEPKSFDTFEKKEIKVVEFLPNQKTTTRFSRGRIQELILAKGFAKI